MKQHSAVALYNVGVGRGYSVKEFVSACQVSVLASQPASRATSCCHGLQYLDIVTRIAVICSPAATWLCGCAGLLVGHQSQDQGGDETTAPWGLRRGVL
eukprot:COSAG01_NODE_595_length_15066_cov_42.464154_5_plen_99_part_00